MKQNTTRGIVTLITLLLTHLLLPSLQAATITWLGDGADTYWTTTANWSGGTAPVANDTLVFDAATVTNPNNNLSADTTIKGVTFNTDAPAYNLTGNRITLAGNIVNNSTATQTIDLPLLLDSAANRGFNTASGNIIFSNTLSYPGVNRYLVKEGPHELIITGTSINNDSSNINRLDLKDGTIRFASGSHFELAPATSQREVIKIGYTANKNTAMIIEEGAYVALGGHTVQMSANASSTSTFNLLVDGGYLELRGTDNTYGDQAGNNVTITIQNGGTFSNGTANAYINCGTRIPFEMNLDDGTVWLQNLSLGRTNDAGGRENGSAEINVRQGLFVVNNLFQWMSTSWAGRLNTMTVGNGTPRSATLSTVRMQRAAVTGTAILNLNGAIIECRNEYNNFFGNLNQVNLMQGGVVIDTKEYNNTITESLIRDTNIPSGTKDGGFTKLGTGTLTMSGAECHFNGPLRVEEGNLYILGTTLDDIEELFLAPGSTLGLHGNSRQNLAPATLALGNGTTTSTLYLDASAHDQSCDTINIPAGGYVGKLNIHLRQRGSRNDDLETPGDYTIFTYTTEPPDTSLLTYVTSTYGMQSSFVVDRSTKSITLRLENSGAQATWSNPGSGNWELNTNWTPGVPANSPTGTARFWEAITTPSTVTLDNNFHLSGLSLRNNNSYTLTGSGTLTLGDAHGYSYLIADQGHHTVELDLILTGNSQIRGASNTSLTINGSITGTGSVVVNEPGTVKLNAANTHSGGTEISSGRLELDSATSLGTGPLALKGGTTSFTGTNPGTFAQKLTVGGDTYLDVGSGNLTLTDELAWSATGTIVKNGSGELILAGYSNSNNSDYQFCFREGTTRLIAGADYHIRSANRDVLHSKYLITGGKSSLIIDSGASLTAGGMRLQVQEVGSQPGETTVHVNGGTLSFMDAEVTIANVINTSGRVYIIVDNGGTLYHASEWFSLGVNSPSTLAITNGTVSLSRLTVGGYRDGVGGGTRNGKAEITIGSGGLLEVRDYLTWITDAMNNPSWIRLAGGTLSLPATGRGTGSTGTASLFLDGGTLECRGLATVSYESAQRKPGFDDYLFGVDQLLLGANGVNINTFAHDVTITQSLAMESGVSSATAFTKSGIGSLTLSSPNTFDAPVTVAAGTLTLQGLPNNDITVATGATLNPSATIVASQTIASATFGANATLIVDIGSSTSDTLNITGALTLGGDLNLQLLGTPQPGTYTLFSYGSLSGSPTNIIPFSPNPAYSWQINDTGSAIQLVVTANNNLAHWNVDSNGTWSTDSNWDPQNAPLAAGSAALFDRSYTAIRTVTPTTPTTLGALLFDATYAPLLSGSSTLTLDNNGSIALIAVEQGNPVIDLPLALLSPAAATLAPETTLALTQNISGSAPLNVTGGGTLTLAATNTTSAINIQDATLNLAATARVTAPITLDGATLTSTATQTLEADLDTTLGYTITPTAATTLTLSGTLTGSGSLTKQGSSLLLLDGIIAHSGITQVNQGTLIATSPLAGPLALGSASFDYQGPNANLADLIINTESTTLAAILKTTSDLSITGRVDAISGGFIKQGSGTLSFTYPGKQTIAPATEATIQDMVLDTSPYSDGTSQGFNPFTITEGTVILGAPDQDNLFQGSLSVGHYSTTTAGTEKDAHLIINGGKTTITGGHLAIGRGNGNTTTAPTPLTSSVTINDGVVKADGLAIGHAGGQASGFNAAPLFTMNGGSLILNQIHISEHLGSDSTFILNDGDILVSDRFRVGHQTTLGGGGKATIHINGGNLEVKSSFNLAETPSSKGTLYLNDGRLSTVMFMAHQDADAEVIFDGGALALYTGPMEGIDNLWIKKGGATIEVTSFRYTINNPLLSGETGDGGLTKTGPGMLALSATEPHTFTGSVTINEGTISPLSADAYLLPATAVLTIAPGAGLHIGSLNTTLPRVQTVASATIGNAAPAEPATLHLWCFDNNQCDQLLSSSSLTLGNVAIYLNTMATEDTPPNEVGNFTIMGYTTNPPDISGLSIANPSPERSYTFTLDTINKRVMLEVAPATQDDGYIWDVDSDGTWSTSSNWYNSSAPLSTPGTVWLSPIITEPRTVTVDAPATLGNLNFNSTFSYTLSGSELLTLSGNNSTLFVTRGNHTIDTPLAVANSGTLTTDLTGNTLAIKSPLSGNDAALIVNSLGVLEVDGTTISTATLIKKGSLFLKNGAELSGMVRPVGGELRAISSSEISGIVELPAGDRPIRADASQTLTITGTVAGPGKLVKDGQAGTLNLTAANTYAGGTHLSSGTLLLSDDGKPGSGTIAMSGGTLATAGETPIHFDNQITINSDSTFKTEAPLTTTGEVIMPTPRSIAKSGTNTWAIAGNIYGENYSYNMRLHDGFLHFVPGSRVIFEGTGSSVRQHLLVNTSYAGSAAGMIVEENAIVSFASLGVQFSDTAPLGSFDLIMNGGQLLLAGIEPLCIGDQGKMVITIINNGGELITTYDNSWTDIGTRSKVHWTMNDGTVSLARAAFGRMNAAGGGRVGGGVTLDISGGRFEVREFFSWKSTDDNDMLNTVTLGNGTPMLGCFSIPATRRYHNGGSVILNLNGGILETIGLYGSDATYQGSLANYLDGVNSLNVLVGGAVIDTLENNITIQQALTPDNDGDGGLTKLGTGALTLTTPVALTGAVDVVEGTLKALFTNTPDLSVCDTAIMDLSSYAAAARFDNISGSGAAVNGTLVVAGSLSPGDAPKEIATFTAENLTFESGSVLYLDYNESANDLFTVTDTLTGTSGGTIDFARDSNNPLDVPFSTIIGTCENFSGSFSGWKVRNSGRGPNTQLAAIIKVENNQVKLDVVSSGLLMILR